jgi:hypothetical protein
MLEIKATYRNKKRFSANKVAKANLEKDLLFVVKLDW